MELPFITADLPGVGGLIKNHLEDFQVDELPLYKLEGVGTHGYFRIEKRGHSTMEAIKVVARALGRMNHDIGYAGLKDAQAVTTQWFSVEHVDSARLRDLQLPHMKVVEVSRHRNKLKIGHLAGNRFTIKIRNPEWTRAGVTLDEPRARAEAILARLAKTGVPNFFGPQRFGLRKNNHLLGLNLLQGKSQEFLNTFLGDPDESVDHGQVLLARQHYAKGRLEQALESWPGHLNQERRALSALIRAKNRPDRALMAVELPLKRLLISALQAYLFNLVLIKRLPRMGEILQGDLAWLHAIGAVFPVDATTELAKEQPRCDAHEISPSGPMFGYRMTEPTDEPGQMEAQVLAEMGLTPQSFEVANAQKSKGGRRSMRFLAKETTLETGQDIRGPFLQLAFSLPAGSFATVLLGEIMKDQVQVD